MAGNIKGIKIEIDGDTQPLQKALKDVNKESTSTTKELREIDKALKFDTGNVVLLGQKQEVLQKQVGLTKEKLEVLRKAQKNVEEEFKNGNIGAEEYRKFQREIEVTNNILGAYENKLESITKTLSGNTEATENSANSLQGLQTETNNLLKADVLMNVADTAGQAGQKMVDFGKNSLEAFKEVDSGMDIITTKTGASGKALEEMQAIASNLAVTIPTDFETAGSAVGELNTQFGFTGEKLEQASSTLIKYAEINGTDVTKSAISAKQAIEAYDLSSDHLGTVLDSVTKISQDTGQSVDDIMTKAVAGAPQIKSLGLSFEEGAVLIGRFEKSGVDSSAALSSLSKATVNYAKDGKTLQQGLSETITAIQNSTSETEALSLASDIFGTKAAPRMVDAIKRGAFSLDDLAEAAKGSSGTVVDTFEATQDPIDKFTTAQNASKKAMADIGNEIATTLAPMLEQLAKFIQGVAEWFQNLDGPTRNAVVVIGLVTAAVLTLTPVVTAFALAMGALNLTMLPVIGAIVTIIAVISAVILIFQNWGAISEWLKGVWQEVCAFGQSLWESFCSFLSVLWDGIVAGWNAMWTSIGDFLSSLWSGISSTASDIWNGLVSFLSSLWNGIASTASGVFNGIANTISGVFNGIVSTVTNVWNGIKNTISSAINGARDAVSSAINAIKGFFNFEFKWPHIPMPHFKVSGSINPVDWIKGNLPSIGVDWYAKGGILTKPTAFGANGNNIMVGGEAGREAVLPLNKENLSQIGYAIAESSGMTNNSNVEALLSNLVVLTQALLEKDTDIRINGKTLVEQTYAEMTRRLDKESDMKTLLRGETLW